MESNARILLVEDEEHLAESIAFNLEMEEYHVRVVNDGATAVKTFKGEKFNLVILDVMLPELDGFSVCEAIRFCKTAMFRYFFCQQNTNEDKIKGLQRGADDYMTKPFNLEEFLLRVHSLLKRGLTKDERKQITEKFKFGENEINFSTYNVTGIGGKNFELTKKEIALLKLLIERKNEVVSREQILETVWGYDIYPSTRTMDNFILLFRKYFVEKDPKNPQYFFSIRGVGYKFMYQ